MLAPIVHSGTNDLAKGKNVLNNVKITIKSVNRFSPQTKLVLSSMIVQKDKKEHRQRSTTNNC